MHGVVRRDRWAGSTGSLRRRGASGWVLAVVTAVTATLVPIGPAVAGPAIGHAFLAAAQELGDGAAAITGQVFDGLGTPLALVDVAVLDAATMAPVRATTTDDAGHYVVADLAPGTYLVAYTKGGFAAQLHDGAADAAGATPLVLAAAGVIDLRATLEWTGGITGTVTDDAGSPVAGAEVTAAGPAATRTVATAADGSYVLPVPAGQYVVAFPTAAGGTTYEPEWWDGAAAVADATPVAVPDVGFRTADAQLVRTPAVWSGTVTHAVTGAPIASVRMLVQSLADSSTRDFSTGADGRYTITGLPDGGYRVWVIPPFYVNCYAGYAEPVTVSAGRVVSRDFALEPEVAIGGALVDPFGNPVPGARVDVEMPTIGGWSYVHDASGGRWGTDYGARGPTYIKGYAPTYVTTWYGGATSRATAVPVEITPSGASDLDLVLEWASGISGTLTSELGGRASGVTVTATGALGTRTTTADAAGEFSVPLPAGDYTLTYAGPGYLASWYGGVLSEAETLQVTVSAGSYTRIRDVLPVAFASLSGTVRATAAAGSTGVAAVQLWADNLTTGFTYAAVTGPDGTYTIGGLEPGEYVLRADTSLAPGYVPRYYGSGGQDQETAERISLTWGDAVTADLVLERTATVAGVVRDAEGGPLADALVDVYQAATGESAGSATSGPDGAFAVTGLLPGSYTVHASASGRIGEYYADAPSLATAQVLELDEGDTAVVAMDLAWAQWIEGVVTDPDGAPVAGADVVVTEWYSGAIVATLTTDAAGTYAVGLLPEYYRVEFEAAGFVPESYDDALSPDAATMVMLMDAPVAVNAQLEWAQGISGTVVDETGTPMADVVVSVRVGDGDRSTVTGPDGVYRLPLPPGDYVVGFHAQSRNPVYLHVYYDGALDPGDAQAVTVVLEQYADADAEMVVDYVVPEFTDVTRGQPFAREIMWLAARGLATGWPDGTFRPAAPVTREAMAAFLHRYVSRVLQPVTGPPPTFTDVGPGNPFAADIAWLASTGIATGWPDGTFRPSNPVNRQAMAAFLYRLAGSPEYSPPAVSPFVDVRPGDPFYAEICWLFEQRIATGTVTASGTYFRPTAPVARQAMAAFLFRFDRALNRAESASRAPLTDGVQVS